MEINIGYLFKEPKLDTKALMTITPLAPLSMVTSMPGSYYKTEKIPTKFMLAGLFENILGWHLSDKDRKSIRKDLKQHYKKKLKLEYTDDKSAVGFLPLVYHLFEIVPPTSEPEVMFFEDMWTQHLIGSDERHLRGVINNDWSIDADVARLKAENSSKKSNKFFEKHRGKFPLYYRSPQQREFMIVKGDYLYKIMTTCLLFKDVQKALLQNNLGYLGTSEGWVHISWEGIKDV